MDDPRVGFFIQVIVGVRRSTSWTVGVARFLIVALALGSLIVPVAASSDRMVIVGFRGLYTDPPGTDIVTHTTIDDPLFGFTRAHYERHFGSQPDLHARIDDDVDTACPPP